MTSALPLDKVRLGTSGWSYADWVGPFYPEGAATRDYLGHYAGLFGTVEVDSTFYAVPPRSTFEAWSEKTPAGFLFAPKVPGIVTHGAEGERPNVARVLLDQGGTLEVFLERAASLGEKLGAIFFQFPYFRVKELRLSDFLPRLEATLRRVTSWAGEKLLPVAVEVRNKTWLVDDLRALLQAFGATLVLLDHIYMPSPEEQLRLVGVTGSFAYIRLIGDRHGIEKKTKSWGSIVEDKSARLEAWARVIASLTKRADLSRVFTFVNNHFAGHGPATCRELAALVRAAAAT